MHEPAFRTGDQADGLRRLFGQRPCSVVALVAAVGEGAGHLGVATAAGLARRGQRTVLVDEWPGPDNAAARLGLGPQRDLADALEGRCEPADVLLPVRRDLWLLPCGRALHRPDGTARARTMLASVTTWADFLLADCPGNRPCWTGAALPVATYVVPVSAASDGVTAGYLRVKRLMAEQSPGNPIKLAIIVTEAKDEGHALRVFRTLQGVARRYLSCHLDFLGGSVGRGADDLSHGLVSRRNDAPDVADVTRLSVMPML